MHEEMINPHVLFTSQGRWLLPVKELEGLERQISALGGIDVIAERGVRALAAAGIARIREDGLARRGGAVIIPIRGVIMPEPNCASSWNGWTTCQELVESVATAMADDSVREIVLDVDSPGGYITGVQEAAI